MLSLYCDVFFVGLIVAKAIRSILLFSFSLYFFFVISYSSHSLCMSASTFFSLPLFFPFAHYLFLSFYLVFVWIYLILFHLSMSPSHSLSSSVLPLSLSIFLYHSLSFPPLLLPPTLSLPISVSLSFPLIPSPPFPSSSAPFV